MNRERIQQVRDLIAAVDDSKFSMVDLISTPTARYHGLPEAPIGEMIHGCGTAACIAGYALILMDPTDTRGNMDPAGEWLGITTDQTYQLFTPPGFTDPDRYSRQDAIRTLDHLLETGEVKWS